ncbi:MAG: tetratricopeptide repeat protein [Terracidiphilus sp.]
MKPPPAKQPPAQSSSIPALMAEAFRALQANRLDEARRLYLKVLAIDVRHADGLHLLGVVEYQAGHYEVSAKMIRRAIAVNSQIAIYHSNLGIVLRDQGKLDEAVAAYKQAVALSPDNPEIHNSLGVTLWNQGRFDEAVAAYKQALELKPDFAAACNNLGNVLSAQGEVKEALEWYGRALAISPGYIEARWNLSMLQLLLGNFADGWRNYESRYQRENAPRNFSQPLWRGKPLNGARILLHAEQGLGDTLQFLRYLPMVQAAGGEVVLDVPRGLRRIAAQLPGIAALTISGEPLPAFDWHCPLMSLPFVFRTTLDTIPAQVPYLTVPEEALQAADTLHWPHEGLRVGLAWGGDPKNIRDRFRSIPLALLEPLFDLKGVHFFSLQMGPAAAQLSAAESAITAITDLAPATGDMADTAAQMAHLDLIVTVDTSVAHLAGALAKPTWVLLPLAPDWRWLLGREDSPWYPTVRLFRQPEFGNWQSVLEKIRAEISALAGGNRDVLKPGNQLEGDGESRQGPAVSSDPLAEIKRRRVAIAAGHTDRERWADETQLEAAWDGRAKFAADYIPSGAAVLDLGCGRMALEKFLPSDCRYIPCDLVRRDARTIVCDFNAGSYPDAQAQDADMVSFLGVLEYVFDPLKFLSHVREWKHPVVMSYCATDGIGGREHRRNLGWVNDFSYNELVGLLGQAGFSIQRADRADSVQWLFRLQPHAPAAAKPKRVGVLSFNNHGNFGDRLGYHLLNDILPANAEVTQLMLKPWTPSEETYDLLIVGIGNSMFGPYLDDNLLSLVDRSSAAIGIFGTQYHAALPKTMLNALLNRLEHWYARYEDDVLRYGRGLGHVSHLGDWLIKAFPMTRPTVQEKLVVGNEIWNDLPLDRTIQKIQQHATVFSTRLHPLLCALTSADKVGYQEQREDGGELISGKFRAMLLDVFGRTYTEGEFFDVDRSQVLIYKHYVETQVSQLQTHLRSMLGTP